jgi:hypothetical protein
MPNDLKPPILKSFKAKTTLAVAAIALVIGYAGGALIHGGRQWSAGHDAAYAEAQRDLSAKLEMSGLLPAPTPIFSLDGKVTEADGASLAVEVPQVNRNPLAENAPTVRRVTLAENGRVVVRRTLTPEEYAAAAAKFQAERDEFLKGMDSDNPGRPPSPPPSYREEPATFTDLKVGDNVTVTAASDIRLATDIAADVIGVNPAVPDEEDAGGDGVTPEPDAME